MTIHITSIYTGNRKEPNVYTTSIIINNAFTVYGKNGEFFWKVIGERCEIEVEPNKKNITVYGDGPYKYGKQNTNI